MLTKKSAQKEIITDILFKHIINLFRVRITDEMLLK